MLKRVIGGDTPMPHDPMEGHGQPLWATSYLCPLLSSMFTPTYPVSLYLEVVHTLPLWVTHPVAPWLCHVITSPNTYIKAELLCFHVSASRVAVPGLFPLLHWSFPAPRSRPKWVV